MKIFVPQHLRKIGALGYLCSMIQEYGKNYKSESGSFDDYQLYLKIDPVRKFIGYCLNYKKEEYGDRYYEEVLNYLTRIFYSVRGTYSVFTYIERYLGLSFVDISYMPRKLTFTIEDKVGDDISLFDKYFRDFLFNLLYIESFSYKIKDLSENIKEDLDFFGGTGIITYRRFNNIEIEQNGV